MIELRESQKEHCTYLVCFFLVSSVHCHWVHPGEGAKFIGSTGEHNECENLEGYMGPS